MDQGYQGVPCGGEDHDPAVVDHLLGLYACMTTTEAIQTINMVNEVDITEEHQE